jgi:SAM-dependent methyltransferase
MDEATIQALLDINHLFYQNFAGAFAQTRRRIQPGVRRVIEALPQSANLVDLGCGNAEVAVQLAQRGRSGKYLGLDFSTGLLAEAQAAWQPFSQGPLSASFYPFDLAKPEPLPVLTEQVRPVDTVFAFAVLHHIPGEGLRIQLLHKVHQVLSEQGSAEAYFVLSVWQFLNSPRLAARCLPWEQVGLSNDRVDTGDYLMDWRREGRGLRYVHHFSPDELEDLASKTGFRVRKTFTSDGEGGNLGLYQVWQ